MGFVCVNQRNLRENIGVLFVQIDWVLLRVFSRRSRRSRRGMQQAALYRRERHLVVSVVLGFVCVNQRNLRETLGFLCTIDWVLLRVILPQIAQIPQRNAASCIISQRKTGCLRLLQLLLFCCFGFCLRKSARSAGDFGVSFVLIDWVRLRLFSRRLRRSRRRMQQAALFRRERQVVWD